jgi:rhamnogalacturonyl hydrolase YesR
MVMRIKQLKLRQKFILLYLLVLSTGVTVTMAADDQILTSAKEKGKLVANDYMSRNILPSSSSFNYFDACSYYGICLLGGAIKDSSFYKSVYTRYKSNKPSSIPTGDVDKNSSGLLPLYLFKLTNDSSMLKLGKAAADNSLQNKGYPRTAIDDTYMTGSLMVQAYRATGEMKYLDFFADYLLTYNEKLQQSGGLYWHKLDSKNFWGRGNGWGAAGATELLMELPATHTKFASVLEGYRKQMSGLLSVQKGNGIWMQLLDSKDPKNWEETSGTAMFLFAIFTGLKYGWLDSNTFLEPAKKGWTALLGHLQGSKLADVAAGFWPSTGTAADYLNASRGQPGDSHGTAAFLWAATAAYHYFSTPAVSIAGRNDNQSCRIVSECRNSNTKFDYFDLSGRLITSGKQTEILQRKTPGVLLMRGLKNNRVYVTISQ